MQSKLKAATLVAVCILPWWTRNANQARTTGPYCLSAPDTAAMVISMVKDVVVSPAPRDSTFRASTGIRAASDSEVVLVVDEAKCQQAIDTLNAGATRYGGPGISGGIYLVSTGSQYAAYAPPGPQSSTGLDFMDAQFHVFATTVVP